MRSRGFSLIELMVTITMLGILVGIATPGYMMVKKHAESARVVADFHVVKNAAYQCYGETGKYPRNTGWGRVPRELRPYLPDGFQFRHGEIRYRWRRWSLPNGLPRRRNQNVLMAMEVRSRDRDLLNSLLAVHKGEDRMLGRRRIRLVFQ